MTEIEKGADKFKDEVRISPDDCKAKSAAVDEVLQRMDRESSPKSTPADQPKATD